MKQLWAPWRLAYIQQEKPSGCIFCLAAASADDRSGLVVYRGPRTFVIMNLFPYNTGHIMVVPYRHIADLSDLDDDEAREIVLTLARAVAAEGRALNPEGYNVGLNLGQVAGAGIRDHLHVHVVPRWAGDTNFMPVLGDVKVIPEHLESTYDRLRRGFADLDSSEAGR
ncbi:MAG TPA: HIT domain-containing protein [bacterium]|jgi:ATP adenylyltransferase